MSRPTIFERSCFWFCLAVLMTAAIAPPQIEAQQSVAKPLDNPDLFGSAATGDKAALRQLKDRAKKGNAEAQWDVGSLYGEGWGVPKDWDEAAIWLRKSADQDFALAQVSLAAMYANGEGLPKDFVAAYMWLNLAAAHGNALAAKNRDIIEKQMPPNKSPRPSVSPANGSRVSDSSSTEQNIRLISCGMPIIASKSRPSSSER